MNTAVPNWIERLLGVESAPGEGTVWHFDHSWHWSLPLTCLLLVCAVAIVWAIYARENPRASRLLRRWCAMLRLGAVVVLVFMLSQLTLVLHRTGLPYLALVLDDSLSMTIADTYDEEQQRQLEAIVRHAGFDHPQRWNLAVAALLDHDAALLRTLAGRYKLRWYYVSGPRRSSAASIDQWITQLRNHRPAGKTTPLGDTIATVLADLRGSGPAAIVLLTDGVNTSGTPLLEAAEEAQRNRVPLHFLAFGRERPATDLRLSDLLVERTVFVGDVVQVEFVLTGTGLAGRKVPIVLKDLDTGGELASLQATVGPDRHRQTLQIAFRPTQPGRVRFAVQAAPQPEERNTDNNRLTGSITISDQKIRVLLAFSVPSYEYRYLRNMLRRDHTIELRTVLQEADPEHVEQDALALRGFPVRREDLLGYDAVILGDLDPSLLGQVALENLSRYVDPPKGASRRGGVLVCIAGPRFMPVAYRDTPLARLLPIDVTTARYPGPQETTEGFRMRPTTLGAASSAMQLGDTPAESEKIWSQLPPLFWYVKTPDVNPGARVLAVHSSATGPSGDPLPLVVMQYVGSGRVLFHATDETWRWRWRTGDLYFARYWVQMIRFLCRAKLDATGAGPRLAADRRRYALGEPVRMTLRFPPEQPAPGPGEEVSVVLEELGKQLRRVSMQQSELDERLYEAVVRNLPVGEYRAWPAVNNGESLTAIDFRVEAPAGELKQVEIDADTMRRAAQMTGGRFYTFAQAQRLPAELPPGEQVPIESLPPRPLWNRWPVLCLFLLLLTAEWTLRKLGAMV